MAEENGPGQPPHEPTDESRKTAAEMTAYGVPQEVICRCLEISLPTLHKYYRKELDTGKANCIQKIANKLVDKALNQEDVTAMIFYLKTQGRWSDKNNEDTEKTKLMSIIEQMMTLKGGV